MRCIALATLVAAGVFTSAQAQDSLFVEVPTKATMISNGTLPVGTRLEFSFTPAKDNETLLLHKCGNPCNTAKLIQTWELKSFPPKARLTAVLDEEGHYYFWIQRRLPGGEVGPVLVDVSTPGPDTVKIRYTSGTEVTVARVYEKKR